MRRKIIVANWKMNKTLKEGIDLVKSIDFCLKKKKPNCEVIICPSFIHLDSTYKYIDNNIIQLGAQDHSNKPFGSYTGDVSASMLSSIGVKYVILGHSERRIYHGETNLLLKEKIKNALANNLMPIFCVGEVLQERENGIQNESVKRQIEECIFNISQEECSKIILAYEPVWAIGTGVTATSAQAQEMHAFIRRILANKYGGLIAHKIPILYGGSCNAENAKELFSNVDIDGGLIGGASLSKKTFLTIIRAFD